MTVSHWRLRARAVIEEVVDVCDTSTPENIAATIKAIDAAYPFGEREHWPYRMWLVERRAAIKAISGPGPVPECRACGAMPGQLCRDIGTGAEREPHASRVASVVTCRNCGASPGESCKGLSAELCWPEVRRG